MYCQFCGAALSASTTECTACGRERVGPATHPPEAPTLVTGSEHGVTATPGDHAGGAAAGGQATFLEGEREPRPAPAPSTGVTGPLSPGATFGSRYHIIRLLGMGGMGAVYQAWDDALGVSVALKIIRPEITADPAAARDLERRFKRELLLARQVTHKNVVRIHDLGEIEGIKYLTMPYIQGGDLSTLLAKEGKFPVKRAIRIARQVASGLQAAHEAGVIHRDLKPANVMIDADDQAVIMDFGIARSVSGGGATMAGAVVGTLEYMAPEQALAKPIDHRADIYSFGLILRDMVLGFRLASRAESAVAELMGRVHNPLPPSRALDPSLPEALERIIDCCTQPDPAARYQTTRQLAYDLELLEGANVAGSAVLSAPPVARTATTAAPAVSARRPRWMPLAAVLAVLVIGGAAALFLRGGGAPDQRSSGPTALAVLPFRNVTGDASLDWLGKVLAEMVRTELGSAPGLRLVPSERVSQLYSDLRLASNAELDAVTLNRLSQVTNTELLVAGQYARAGAAITLQATMRGGDRAVVPVTAEAANDDDLPQAVRALVAALQRHLTLAPATAADGRSTLPGPTSSSMAALRAYSEGEQLSRDNRHQDALAKFQLATKEDPQFAFAFAKLAQTYRALGYSKDAEQTARQAADLSQGLPAEHRYVIDAMRAGSANDTDRAIEAYEQLEGLAPNDTQLLFDLARLYETRGNLDGARDRLQRVLERDPKYVSALLLLGQVEIRRRNFDEALKHLQPAFSEAVQASNEPAKGSALHAIGVAFKRLDKPADALANYEQALKIRRTLNDRRGVAATLTEIGQVQLALGRPDATIESYEEALTIRREIGDRQGAGNTLLNLGFVREQQEDYDRALDLYRQSLQIQVDIGNEATQGLCQNNIASIHLLQGRYDDAVTYFQQALVIREKFKVPSDVAETLHGLAETQAKTGQFDQALTNYLRALELRRQTGDTRAAATVSHGIAGVFVQRGRYNAALESSREALEVFRDTTDNRWLVPMLDGYAAALVLMGRSELAQPVLDEATERARALNTSRLLAQVLNTRGDAAFYRAEYNAARSLFEQALQVAAKAGSPEVELRSALNVAKADAKDNRARAAVSRLRQVAARAENLRLRPLAAEATLHLGDALMQIGDRAVARRELEAALSLAEKLSMVPLAATAHHLLGRLHSEGGDERTGARHSAEARQLVDTLRKEAGSDDLLGRSDLKDIVASATP